MLHFESIPPATHPIQTYLYVPHLDSIGPIPHPIASHTNHMLPAVPGTFSPTQHHTQPAVLVKFSPHHPHTPPALQETSSLHKQLVVLEKFCLPRTPPAVQEIFSPPQCHTPHTPPVAQGSSSPCPARLSPSRHTPSLDRDSSSQPRRRRHPQPSGS
jgi:hypothetical protein